MVQRNGRIDHDSRAESLRQVYDRIRGRLRLRSPLPNSALCENCQDLDPAHPAVRQAASEIDPTGKRFLLGQASCRCHLEQRRLDDRRARQEADANLPALAHPRTFANFYPRPGTNEMVKAATRFGAFGGPRILTLYGGTGVGKTHLLEAIGRAWLAVGETVRYELVPAFLERLRDTYQTGPDQPSLHALTRWYDSRSLLLLDDLGMERRTDYATEKLTSIVEHRLNSNRHLVVATNLTKTQLAERTDERLASRLWITNSELSEAQVIICRASDYRQ